MEKWSRTQAWCRRRTSRLELRLTLSVRVMVGVEPDPLWRCPIVVVVHRGSFSLSLSLFLSHFHFTLPPSFSLALLLSPQSRSISPSPSDSVHLKHSSLRKSARPVFRQWWSKESEFLVRTYYHYILKSWCKILTSSRILLKKSKVWLCCYKNLDLIAEVPRNLELVLSFLNIRLLLNWWYPDLT